MTPKTRDGHAKGIMGSVSAPMTADAVYQIRSHMIQNFKRHNRLLFQCRMGAVPILGCLIYNMFTKHFAVTVTVGVVNNMSYNTKDNRRSQTPVITCYVTLFENTFLSVLHNCQRGSKHPKSRVIKHVIITCYS